MRKIKYRIPHRCQNGHFRWLYFNLNNGFYNTNDWGPLHPDCKCPSFGVAEGFKQSGDPQQFTGQLDSGDTEIYECDFVLYTRKNWRCPGHRQNGKDLIDLCEIYWDEKISGFANNSRGVGRGSGRIYSSGAIGFSDNRAQENIVEVIGNTVENPDTNVEGVLREISNNNMYRV